MCIAPPARTHALGKRDRLNAALDRNSYVERRSSHVVLSQAHRATQERSMDPPRSPSPCDLMVYIHTEKSTPRVWQIFFVSSTVRPPTPPLLYRAPYPPFLGIIRRLLPAQQDTPSASWAFVCSPAPHAMPASSCVQSNKPCENPIVDQYRGACAMC